MDIRTRDDGRNHIREMLIDDKVVCWLTVIDFTQRFGSARLRMAGIAGVETRPEHRMKGYMRVLFEDTVRYMTAEGYDVTLLFGIPDFYTKFGYAVCLPGARGTLSTRNAERAQATASSSYTLRPATDSDLSAILDLYERNNATRTGTLLRPPAYFTRFRKGSNWWRQVEAAVLLDAQAGIVGYAVWDKVDDEVAIIEVECASDTSESVYASLLYAFAQQAIAKRCGQVHLHLPPDHPFADWVQRFGCEWTLSYPRAGDGMGRILNQGALFDKLTGELTSHLQDRVLPAPGAHLSLCTELGALALHIDAEGGVQINHAGASSDESLRVELPQHILMQLLTGYRSVRDVCRSADVSISPAAQTWLELLFPKGFPYMWQTDMF
jgi:predicted acetyltransferase